MKFALFDERKMTFLAEKSFGAYELALLHSRPWLNVHLQRLLLLFVLLSY